MKKVSGEERALARAAIYRLLALVYSYPTTEVIAAIAPALEAADVAADLIDEVTCRGVERLRASFGDASPVDTEAWYQKVFTLSYNEDCPPYETAFSASHLFQQTQHLADIAGFYKAFGVEPGGERPDHLALELEFCYLLALKEATAREGMEPENIRLCRNAQRVFLAEHLARWAPLIGQRVAVTGAGSPYEGAGRLLTSFIQAERRFLRLGQVEQYRDEPVLMADEPGEMTCPLAETAVASMDRLADAGEGGRGPNAGS